MDEAQVFPYHPKAKALLLEAISKGVQGSKQRNISSDVQEVQVPTSEGYYCNDK